MSVLDFESGLRGVAADVADIPVKGRLGHATWMTARRRRSPLDVILRRIIATVTAIFRLVVPVTLLLVLLGTVYLYADMPWTPPLLPRDLTGYFTAGDAIIPLAAFSIQLTSRRYGPNYATAQLLVALALALAVTVVNPPQIHAWLANLPVVDARTLLAFALSFLLANLTGITFFEAARGPNWWTAPLTGALVAQSVFCCLYYPLAFAGLDVAWASSASAHVLVFAAEAAALLLPYWFLRSALPPLAGLNGY